MKCSTQSTSDRVTIFLYVTTNLYAAETLYLGKIRYNTLQRAILFLAGYSPMRFTDLSAYCVL